MQLTKESDYKGNVLKTHAFYIKLFLEDINKALKVPEIEHSGQKAVKNIFAECVEFGVNLMMSEISKVHSLCDDTDETKELIKASKTETDQ